MAFEIIKLTYLLSIVRCSKGAKYTYGEQKLPVRRNLHSQCSETARWRICTPASMSYTAGTGVTCNTGVWGTLQVDCGSVFYCARILTTHGVVPQCRCGDVGWRIGQTDDEIVRSVNCKSRHANTSINLRVLGWNVWNKDRVNFFTRQLKDVDQSSKCKEYTSLRTVIVASQCVESIMVLVVYRNGKIHSEILPTHSLIYQRFTSTKFGYSFRPQSPLKCSGFKTEQRMGNLTHSLERRWFASILTPPIFTAIESVKIRPLQGCGFKREQYTGNTKRTC